MNNLIEYNDWGLNEYKRRINKVLEYIDDNLGSDLSLAVLSEVALFSPYHFHRIFSSIIGESPHSYIMRLRLSKAAERLVFTNRNTSITEIAMQLGFSSSSDFSRSFKHYFRISPSQYLKAGLGERNFNNDRKTLSLDYIQKDDCFERNIRIKMLNDFDIAYIRVTGLSENLKSKEIEAAYRRLYRWVKARDLIYSSTTVLGITLDNPEVTKCSMCRYDVCITVPHDTQADGEIGIRRADIGGRYVTYSFERSETDYGENFFRAMNYIYGYWLPNNGFLPDSKPFVEIHHRSASTNKDSTDFYIPIVPL